jgi:hypothetical protein
MVMAQSAAAHGEDQALHQPHGTVTAARTPRPPSVDGRLSEEMWVVATPAADFTQTDPDEGQPATESTEVRVLFDDDALYVGVRLYDAHPDAIVRRLAKRDEDPDGDRVTVYLDPMHDHLTGAFFRVSASGVQKDAAVFNDTWDDTSWDAVWQSAVSIDELSWSVEIRIPLSQLRFQQADRAVWGINVARYLQRKNETTWLERVPKTQNGLASRMAHLVGLDGIARHRRLQMLPYAAARAEFIGGPNTLSPFNDGARPFGAGGIDMKWGISSNVTLDATMNPDFGQVEVDPAVVNLTAFEVFFEERRPFFLEGAQIFQNFGRGGANNYWGFNSSDPNLFYSRRIGRAPQRQASGDFVDAPTGTTIVAAAKVTGKTRSGWSIGLLDAMTDAELARTSSGGVLGRMAVEPRTNYTVLRLQRDIGRRAGLGVIATSVARQLETAPLAAFLPKQATVVGADAYWFLGPGREWVVNGRLAVSRISGTAEAMTRAQTLVQRSLQRPDAPHVSFDPTRTSLSGFTGRVNLNRNAGLWQVNAALWGVSPGFESNDLGFLTTGDRAGAHAVVMRRKVIPDRFSRSRSLWIAKWWTWNFGRELQSDGVTANAFVTFRNWWTLSGGGSWRRRAFDDRLTRGGVSAVAPGGGGWTANMSTDARRPVSVQVATNGRWDESGAWNRVLGATVSLKPVPQLVFTIGPQLTRGYTTAQYIRSLTDSAATETFGRRDLFGLLDQTQLSITLRASIVVTPRVSLQVFAQPLLSAGRYAGFRELARPRTFDFVEYGTSTTMLAYDPSSRRYEVDPDGPGAATPFGFADPDFNLKSLRVNSVFRWDLRPGSAFYAVWTRQQQDAVRPGAFDLGRDLGSLFSAPGDDVVMVKIAYWFGG